MTIKQNIQQIQDTIKSINPDAKLVVVGKKHSLKKVQQVIDVGITDIAENKWQEFEKKYLNQEGDNCNYHLHGTSTTFHFIGHLQTNKVKQAVKHFDIIQSVDSLKLAEKINSECAALKKMMPIMIQINVSLDENKFGIVPHHLKQFLQDIKKLSNIKLIGLMAITALESDEIKKQDYQNMKQLFDQFKDEYNLTELSMGMSSDYKIALECGATMVRVGSAIFY